MKRVIVVLMVVLCAAAIAHFAGEKMNAHSDMVMFDENVEALTDNEINLEMLKQMLDEKIWMYTINAWSESGFSIYCQTGGCLQCFVPNINS